MNKNITFSFGKNWQEYLGHVNDIAFEDAKKDILFWLKKDDIIGKNIIDIGCGSGMSSMAFHSIGAKNIISFDYDKRSVAATKILWEKSGKPNNWKIFQGSILDVDSLDFKKEKFDLVYSWGVLHHTGDMKRAINNCFNFIKPEGGKLWIALYQKGPKFPKHLRIKKKYNSSSSFTKKIMVYEIILKMIILKLINFKNPFDWNKNRIRGMDAYYDIIDWLGGLPYEVISEDEIVQMCSKSNLMLERIKVAGEGGCSNYIFKSII